VEKIMESFHDRVESACAWAKMPNIFLAAIVTTVTYVPCFLALLSEATTNPYAAHVVLVPGLASVMVWVRRREFQRLPFGGNTSALAIIAGAAVLLIIGYRAANVALQSLSFVVAIGGLVFSAYGRQGLRRMAFVLAFLLLMVPPPRGVITMLSPLVQHFVAVVTGVILRVIGVPVIQDGIVLGLVGVTLEVAEECSGLRFLLVLVVCVAAFARLTLPTFKEQLLCTALSVPVAMVANITRVVLTSAGTYFFGPYVVTGSLHYHIGKGCWLAALFTMVAGTWLCAARSRADASDRMLRSAIGRA
jgi:exosortase